MGTSLDSEAVELELATRYFPWVRNGTKTLTVRRGHLEYPVGPASFHDEEGNSCAIDILEVRYSTFKDLQEGHARADGFRDLKELKEALLTHYPNIIESDEVTMIRFRVGIRRANGLNPLPPPHEQEMR